MFAQVLDVGSLIDVKTVREARRELVGSRHRPRESPETRGFGSERIRLGAGAPARHLLTQQELVERRSANIRADIAVCMQETAAVALPAYVFARQLEGGAGAAQELRFLNAD